jgi:hypothetical protein
MGHVIGERTTLGAHREVTRPHASVPQRRRSDPQDDIVAGMRIAGRQAVGQEGIRVGVFGDEPGAFDANIVPVREPGVGHQLAVPRGVTAKIWPVVSLGAIRSPANRPNVDGATALPPSTLGAVRVMVLTTPRASTVVRARRR